MKRNSILVALLFVTLLCCTYQEPLQTRVSAQTTPKIVFDYSHGQYDTYVAGNETHPAQDWYLRKNLTAMGYEIVWTFGGLNDSLLSDADALIVSSIYGEQEGFAQSEIDAVSDWFNTGNKFLWVGSDSDYGGASYINSNMSWMLEEVGSHVYPEPTSIEDSESNCGAAYRVVANETNNGAYVSDIVDDVSKVIMHGPTCLYGSTSATAGANAVSLEDTDIENVYPLLSYGDGAHISDADLLSPYAHDNGDSGPLVATALETKAGTDGSGVIVVSGASPYGDYMPMYTADYYDINLDGYNLVKQAINWGITSALSWIPTESTDTTVQTTTTETTEVTTTREGFELGLLFQNPMMLSAGIILVAVVAVGLVVAGKSKKPKPTTEPSVSVTEHKRKTGDEVAALRGCEIVGGQFKYKVKVKNDTNYVITNVTVSVIAYPEDCMDLSGDSVKRISRVEPGAFRSPEFVFNPTKDCVEGQIVANVSYMDYQNKPHTIQVEPHTIRSVCDLLKPLGASLEQFDVSLEQMECTSEKHEIEEKPESVYSRAKSLLPMKNFKIIDASSKAIGGEFTGTIRGFAEGKYTGKKMAVQILISGPTDEEHTKIVIEGLGEDMAMLPTTIREISTGMDAWKCLHCGGLLSSEQVSELLSGKPIECQFCKGTLTVDQYRGR
jgi:hypothetical protein